MILVIANYRTGSSTLVHTLSQLTGYNYSNKGGEYLFDIYRPPTPQYDIYKVMPTQVKDRQAFVDDYINKADNIFYSVRRDFDAQCRSWISAKLTAKWHPNYIKASGTYDPNIQTTPELTQHEIFLEGAKAFLLENLKLQAVLYKQYPGTICWLEDRLDKDKKYPAFTKPNLDWTSGINPEDYFK